jgi:cytochrome c-type biogenesis protein CcmH
MRRSHLSQTTVRQTARHKEKRGVKQISHSADSSSQPQALSVRHAAVAGVAITVAAGLLYGLFGRPDLPDQPLYKRSFELAQKQAKTRVETAALDAAFDAAQKAATEQPDEVTSWLQLALAAARTGNSKVEINALQNALSLSDGAANIKAMIAEALSRAAGGQVTIPARQLINEILQVEPNEPRALFLWGLAAYQDEAYQLAIDRWAYLYQLSAPNAPWRERLEDSIRQAADDGGLPAPDLPEKAKANTSQGEADSSQMSAAEQQAMIEGMVAGLAARLEDSPDDREGWLRLARSYKVLGRPDEQINALFRAAELDKSDIAVLIKLSEVILQSGESEQHAQRIGKLFEQNEVRDKPRFQAHPQWLFFRGHFALSENNIPLARESWSKLLAGLPPDSELANLLTEKLATLP